MTAVKKYALLSLCGLTLFCARAQMPATNYDESQVPAYTLPEKLEKCVVMRIVCRQGMSRDMTDMLLSDIQNAIDGFEKLEYPTQTRIAMDHNQPVQGKVYTHTHIWSKKR